MPNFFTYKEAKAEFAKLSAKYRLTMNHDNYLTELEYDGRLVIVDNHPGDNPSTEVMYGVDLGRLPYGRKAYMLMAELAMTPWEELEDDRFIVPLFIDFEAERMVLLTWVGGDLEKGDFPFSESVVLFGENVPSECMLTNEKLRAITPFSKEEFHRYDCAKIKPSELDERATPEQGKRESRQRAEWFRSDELRELADRFKELRDDSENDYYIQLG